MPKIIKDGSVIEDSWTVWRDGETLPQQGQVIVPVSLWQSQREALQSLGEVAVFLASDESPKLIADSLDALPMVAIDFPKFADGRGFSYARALREQHRFEGEIRAIGDFMRDQLFYLQRCGVNSFALDNDGLEAALASLKDFDECYQPGVDQPLPLFRRRA